MENFSFAVRENNSKRKHIVINSRQGRYVPVSPTITDGVFRTHAESVKRFLIENQIPLSDIVVIGFAEAAVAIGAYIADELDAFYIASTRESIPGYFDTITFEERHSHAANHSLCVRDKTLFEKARCIVLAEDEFTTGNTVLGIINVLQKYISSQCTMVATAFIASSESRRLFADNGILCFAENVLDDIDALDDINATAMIDTDIVPGEPDAEICLNSVLDFRLGVEGREYFDECLAFSRLLADDISRVAVNARKIDVVCTEECGTPSIVFGKVLADRGYTSSCHSIVRTPIITSDDDVYAIRNRIAFDSLYETGRRVYLYNHPDDCDVTVIITDAERPDEMSVKKMCGAIKGKVIVVYWSGKRVKTSLKPEDGIVLLKDVTGAIAPMTQDERETAVQNGVHYSETLPVEFYPTSEHMKQFERGVVNWSGIVASAVKSVSEQIYAADKTVIVSLARAGTPIGALIVRYLRKRYGNNFVHYSVSIIKGKGIDDNAMRYILARHSAPSIQFVDGWTGKGAIADTLKKALKDYPAIDSSLAVLSDPAGVCNICGTKDDIFIPCSCLNSIVSGLFSRTILRDDIVFSYDFHGAVYFSEFENLDNTYNFIEAIESKMDYSDANIDKPYDRMSRFSGEINSISRVFCVSVDYIKPGIGETTRALLRRVPSVILVDKKGSSYTSHIESLAAEKGIHVVEYPLNNYHACAIIEPIGQTRSNRFLTFDGEAGYERKCVNE